MAKSRLEKKPWLRIWALKATLLLTLVALFLAGVMWAGRWGLDQLQGRARYLVEFYDIGCESPVGMDKREFLDEVRFESQLPSKLNLLDDDLAQQLREGFAKHPWVEKVDAVSIQPPRHIAVTLTFRTPVLAVKVGAKMLAIDGLGVLLRPNAPTLGLPVYAGDAKPPQGGAGTHWGDANVEAAARKLRK